VRASPSARRWRPRNGSRASLSFTLAELERAIRDAWSLDTADPENDWSPENPGCGQCDITSLVVHDLLGGELLSADVYLNGERVEAHMWNRLPSGIEIDLTSDQFRRGEIVGEPTPRPRPLDVDPTHPRYFRYEQYVVLSERVRRRLGLPS
jgi:hypothetical protein